jgi:hypothetical protein
MIAMTTSSSTNVNPVGNGRIVIAPSPLFAPLTRLTPLAPIIPITALRKSPQFTPAEHSLKQSFERFSVAKKLCQLNPSTAEKERHTNQKLGMWVESNSQRGDTTKGRLYVVRGYRSRQ